MGEGNEKNILEKEIRRHGTGLAMQVSCVSIVINVVLSAFKVGAGILSHSGAMISDGIHSASDVFSTLIVMAGITMASMKSDREHPYGHERMECVAALLLSAVLFATGIAIGVSAVETIGSGPEKGGVIPGTLALGAAVISIVVKEWMFWYTRAAARKLKSGALMADAWHHRSDALSSVGALIGILGARMGMPVMDPLASFIICIFIVKAALDVFRDSMDKMVDKACDDETVRSIEQAVLDTRGVERVGSMKTRLFGSRIYVDLEIEADKSLMLEQAFGIAKEVHDTIEERFPQVKHCSVQVSPEGSRGLEGKEN
ncbi:cation transporter [Enterocloster clostridioformis]|uniref:cation diffusion facilitator family transporter n=1 Tax=Enterocloster clostridioformis TaxID=1531 RepID=UPI00080CA7E9|nr:cation diffusion facilitator family transporter [Enterocloster clostridioformis]ANU45368.1 cation-efflux pump [Lachnoclostridium sp. YL32]NDO32319.1 cation transporter [Enterocloster clostridioformis]OXE63349.1 cation transporter [Enterocloster clostridioformis]QQQ99860.1 cation transporter [Enterocloster clostridioformis]